MSLHQLSFVFTADNLVDLRRLATAISPDCVVERWDEPAQQLFYIFEPGSQEPSWVIGRERDSGAYMVWDCRDMTMLAWGRSLPSVILAFRETIFGQAIPLGPSEIEPREELA